MTDVPPHSGNRWEPAPAVDAPTAEQPWEDHRGRGPAGTERTGAAAERPVPAPPADETAPTGPGRPRSRGARVALAVAAAVGIVAAAGTTGFTVGRSIGDGPATPTSSTVGDSSGRAPRDGHGPRSGDGDDRQGVPGGTGVPGGRGVSGGQGAASGQDVPQSAPTSGGADS